MNSESIDFTPEKLKRLKKAYSEALKEGKQVFTFDTGETGEHELLVSYAKYLVEYLELVFKEKR